MEQPNEKHYALWLIPPPNYFAILSDRIAELSQEYDTPCFAPHVTVLGFNRVDNLLKRAYEVARSTEPFTLRLQEVVCGDAYFRRVYARVAPCAELSTLFTASRARFEDTLSERTPTLQEYEPHLSLAYGDLSARQCEELATRVRKSGLPESPWLVDGLDVVDINGEPEQWSRAAWCAFLGEHRA